MKMLFKCRGCGQRMSVEKTIGTMAIECLRCHQTTTLYHTADARQDAPVGVAPPATRSTPTMIPGDDLVPINLPKQLDPTSLLVCPKCHVVKKKHFAWHWFGKAKHSPPHPVFCRKCKSQLVPADSPRGQALLMQLVHN